MAKGEDLLGSRRKSRLARLVGEGASLETQPEPAAPEPPTAVESDAPVPSPTPVVEPQAEFSPERLPPLDPRPPMEMMSYTPLLWTIPHVLSFTLRATPFWKI